MVIVVVTTVLVKVVVVVVGSRNTVFPVLFTVVSKSSRSAKNY